MFISRTELLPEEETVEEHQQARELETAVTKSDEIGLGLFKGMFRTQGRRGMPNLDIPGERGGAIRDFGDGVLRCPECLWELVHGECGRCGFRSQDFSDGPDFSADDVSDDDDDSDLDHEIDEIDVDFGNGIRGTLRESTPYADTDVGTEYTVNSAQNSPGHNVGRIRGLDSSQTSSDEDSELEEDDEDDEEMHGFVVDDHDEQDGSDTSSNTSEESTRTEQPHFYGIELEMGTGIGSDSDSSDAETTRSSQHSITTRSTKQSNATSTTDGSDSDDPESDDATPTPENRPFQRRGGGRIIHDEDDEDDELRVVEAVDLTQSSTTPPRSREERNAHLTSRRSARGRRNQGNNNFDADFPSIQDLADDDEPIRSTRRPSGRGRSRPPADNAWRDMRRDGPAASYQVRVA